MQASRFQRFFPLLAVLGSVTALGIGTSWAKHWLFPLVGAQGTTAVRVGLSAVLMLLLWRPWRWRLSKADATALALYGAALGGMNLMFYMALRTLPFGVAVAIEFSGPLAVAIWSSRRAIDFMWVALAIAGLGLLLPIGLIGSVGAVGAGSSTLDPVGVLYAMAAAVCWAMYIVFGKRAGHLHAGHAVSVGLFVAALVVVPVGVVHAGMALWSLTVLLIGAAVAAVSSAIPISLEMMALKRLPREAFGIMISMEPAVAAVLAMGLLGEHLNGLQWLAIGCIVAASMGSALTARRAVPAAAQVPLGATRTTPDAGHAANAES